MEESLFCLFGESVMLISISEEKLELEGVEMCSVGGLSGLGDEEQVGTLVVLCLGVTGVHVALWLVVAEGGCERVLGCSGWGVGLGGEV